MNIKKIAELHIIEDIGHGNFGFRRLFGEGQYIVAAKKVPIAGNTKILNNEQGMYVHNVILG